MKKISIALLASATLVGCGKTPVASDIKPFLIEALAKENSNVDMGEPQVDVSQNADKFKVKFKAPVSLKEDLYEKVDSLEVLKTAGSDEKDLENNISTLSKLPLEVQEKLNSIRPKNATDIIFLKKTSEKSSQGQWYGAADCAFYVDKWGCSNLVTDSQATFPGKPKASFGNQTIIVLDTAEGKKALADLVSERGNFLAQLKLSEDLHKQAQENESALQVKLQEENTKRIAAENAATAMARRMPIDLKMRNAAISSKGKVLNLTNTSSNEITLDISVSNGTSAKNWRLTVPALKHRELGWAEGWAFAFGDEVTITSTNFDQITVRLR